MEALLPFLWRPAWILRRSLESVLPLWAVLVIMRRRWDWRESYGKRAWSLVNVLLVILGWSCGTTSIFKWYMGLWLLSTLLTFLKSHFRKCGSSAFLPCESTGASGKNGVCFLWCFKASVFLIPTLICCAERSNVFGSTGLLRVLLAQC